MEAEKKGQYWIFSGLLSLLQNFSGVLFGFASFFILIRLLSKHEFGAWTLFMSTITILETVRNGLIQSALVKFISGAPKEEHGRIISASFTISGSVTVVCVILNVAFAHFLARLWDTPELTTMFYLYNIVFLLSGVLTQFNCIEQANLQFKGIFISNLIRQSSFFGFILVCFAFNFNFPLWYLVVVQIVSVILSMVPAYYYVRPDLHFIRFSSMIYGNKVWIGKLFNYGKYAFGTSVSSLLSGTIDQMMLGAMLSPVASGSFNIAVRVTNLIDIPTNAMASIVFPQSAKRIVSEGKSAIKYLYEKSVGTTLAIAAPIVLILFLFADQVIWLIASDRYEDAVPLLKITLLTCLLMPYGRQFGTILDSMGRTKLTFFIVLGTATLNLSLNFVFIDHFGVMGAAYATLCSNILGFLVAQVILRKELGVSIYNTFIYGIHFYPDFFSKYIAPYFRKSGEH